MSQKPRSHANDISDAAEELLSSWPIPEFEKDTSKLAGRSNALGTPLAQMYAKEQAAESEADAQSVDEPELPKLTLQELEQIRQDAYEEGLKQGHEQGYVEGFDKGANEGREAGLEQGQEQGLAEGLEQAQPHIDEQLNLLKNVLSELETPTKLVTEEVEKELILLACELAKAITYVQAQEDESVILSALKAGVDALGANDVQTQIYLHPDDLNIIEQHFDAEQREQRHWQLFAEPTLERGGCQIKQQRSSIDMRLSQRIAQVITPFLAKSGVEIQSDNHE